MTKQVEWASAVSTNPNAKLSDAKAAVTEAIDLTPVRVGPEQILPSEFIQGDSFHTEFRLIDGTEYITWEEARRYAEWIVDQFRRMAGV